LNRTRALCHDLGVPNRQPALEIREVDPADRDEMVAFQEVYERAERAEFPDADVYTLEDAVAILSRAPLGWLYTGYAAFDSGRMVGEAMIIASTVDNLRSADLRVWVPPQHRRRGIGRQLAAYLVAQCQGLGRDVLHTSATYPFERRDDHPYRRFAEGLGFRLANTEVERRLLLPVADELLTQLAVYAAPHHGDYRIHPHVGPIPVELAQGYCDVSNRLAVEAPRGDLVVEARQRTPEILADQDAEITDQGRTRVSAFALDPQGELVALTSSAVSLPGNPGVNQYATIVRPDHRGHRLGMAVKVAQIGTIQSAFPDKTFISTQNAESNTHMVAINEALGFEPRALVGEFQRLASTENVDPVIEQRSAGVA
jgi:GNAT superfamily N-acetyltransferase